MRSERGSVGGTLSPGHIQRVGRVGLTRTYRAAAAWAAQDTQARAVSRNDTSLTKQHVVSLRPAFLLNGSRSPLRRAVSARSSLLLGSP